MSSRFLVQESELVIESLADDLGLELAFCPTGEDGGIDNSCSPANKGTGRTKVSGRVEKAVSKDAKKIKFTKVNASNKGKLDAWLEGSHAAAYKFETKSGRQFSVKVEEVLENEELEDLEEDIKDLEQKMRESDDPEVTANYEETLEDMYNDRDELEDSVSSDIAVSFVDDKGKVDITGRGEAFQVFTKVLPAIVAYVQKKKPTGIQFSAKGESRVELYERLVKSVLAIQTGYKAMKWTSDIDTRWDLRSNVRG